MKKFLSLLLALVMTLSLCFAAFSVTSFATENNFAFAPFSLNAVDGKTLTVDTKNLTICGVSVNQTVDSFLTYFNVNDGYSIIPVANDGYMGTGASLIVKKGDDVIATFKIVMFGDFNGDSAVDVLDVLSVEQFVTGNTAPEEVTEIQKKAIEITEDGRATVADYSYSVNAALSGGAEQKAIPEEKANTANVEDEYVLDKSAEEMPLVPVFNGAELDPTTDYDIVCDGEVVDGYKIVEAVGKNLYTGTMFIKVPVVSVVWDTAEFVSSVIKDTGLDSVLSVISEKNQDTGKETFTLQVNTNAALTQLKFNVSALDGIIAKIKTLFNEKYSDETLVVGGYKLAENGTIFNTEVKNILVDAANGIFTDIGALDETGILRAYEGSVTRTSAQNTVTNNFELRLSFVGNNIDKLKDLGQKAAQYLEFSMIDGNAHCTVIIPRSFMNMIVEGQGSVEEAKNSFNSISVELAFFMLSDITANEFNETYGAYLEKIAKVFVGFSGIVNKVLGNIKTCTITDMKGSAYTAFAKKPFAVEDKDPEVENVLGDCVWSVANMLTSDVLNSKTGDYYDGDGIYTVEFNVSLNIAGISEKVFLHLDMFDIED